MIGGDFTLRQARRLQLDGNRDSLIVKSEETNQHSSLAVFNILINIAQGSDALFLAYSFKVGIAGAFFICLSLLLVTQYTFSIYMKSWRYGREYNYIDIWRECVSKEGAIIPKLLLLICFESIAASFSYEVYDDLYQIVSSLTTPPEIMNNKWLGNFLVTFIVAFIGVFPSKLIGLNWLSLISNIGLLVSGFAVIVAYIMNYTQNGFDPEKKLIWISSDIEAWKGCIGSFATIFFCHPIICRLIGNVKNPTYKRVSSIVWATNIFTGVYSLIIGYCSYFFFMDVKNDDDNILILLKDSNFYCYVVGMIGCYICTIFTLTCIFNLLLASLCDVFIEGIELPLYQRFIYITPFVCLNVLFNFVGDFIFDVLNLIGHISFIGLAFILPLIYYFKNFGFSNKLQSVLTIAVFTFGLGLQMFVVVTTIIDLI